MMGANGSRQSELRARLSPDRGAPPVEVTEALERVRGTNGIDFTSARARAGFSRGHLLDVVVSLPGGAGSDEERSAARS
ncbi:MAG TPA: hypothetical protein VF103_12495, partial [Polyangiaceae bacterium]